MHKLIHLDNQASYGQNNINVTSDFRYDGSMFYFADMRSSTVKSITVEGTTMTVATRNSRYTFEKVN